MLKKSIYFFIISGSFVLSCCSEDKCDHVEYQKITFELFGSGGCAAIPAAEERFSRCDFLVNEVSAGQKNELGYIPHASYHYYTTRDSLTPYIQHHIISEESLDSIHFEQQVVIGFAGIAHYRLTTEFQLCSRDGLSIELILSDKICHPSGDLATNSVMPPMFFYLIAVDRKYIEGGRNIALLDVCN